jgi:hypothetical protein
MFRDDRQTSDAVRVLLRSVGLERLWTDAGPTEEALKLRDQRGGPMSHGEALVLLAAFDFWNGQGKVQLSDLLAVLDGERTRLIATLMIAASEGASAVDRWIAEHRAAPHLRSI